MSNNKRLERDLQNRVLGGVCSGLGNYFEMDPTFWRVLFFLLVLLPFVKFPSFLVYIILWIVMPAKQPGSNESIVQDAEIADEGGTPQKNKGNMMAGLILIGIGAIGLMARYIPQISWRIAWPIILIVIGIFLIIPKSKNS